MRSSSSPTLFHTQIYKHLSVIGPSLEGYDPKATSYIHAEASVKDPSKVGSEAMVGAFTEIAADTIVKHCIIGNHCKIGRGVSRGDEYNWGLVSRLIDVLPLDLSVISPTALSWTTSWSRTMSSWR